MYDDFWTQTPLGILEFSDEPMHNVPKSDQYHDFFAARHVTKYLENYVRSHVYAGNTLLDRVQLETTVESLTKHGDIWNVKVQGLDTAYVTSKVIDATGLTSVPNIPNIPGSLRFEGQKLHHRSFGQSAVLTDSAVQDVVVLGGAKSAADVAYAAAKAGKKVTWIIRKSGSGPAAFVAAKGQGPYSNSNESFFNRFTSHFLASVFWPENWLTSFLYQTRIGRSLVARMWKGINKKSHQLADYDRPDGQANGFHNLKPDTELFWTNESPGTNQRDDFFDVIATKVQVHRQDIALLAEHSVILANDTRILADAIVFATGWQSTQTYLDPSTSVFLGLPVDTSEIDLDVAKRWTILEEKADEEVLARFPLLQNAPPHRQPPQTLNPFRLYSSVLPLTDHTILFPGRMMLGNHFRNAEVQALYSVAILDGKLQIPSKEVMEQSTAKMVAWCRRRYLTKGRMGNWMYFDMVPYTDMLLEQMGLRSHRKSGWRDWFEPCYAKDLRGLTDEYKSKYAASKE